MRKFLYALLLFFSFINIHAFAQYTVKIRIGKIKNPESAAHAGMERMQTLYQLFDLFMGRAISWQNLLIKA